MPLSIFATRLKARPADPTPEAHFRVRHDRVDKSGRITLRYLSRLHHVGVGRAFIGLRVPSSWPTNRSASSARTGHSSASSASTPAATTSPWELRPAGLDLSTMT